MSAADTGFINRYHDRLDLGQHAAEFTDSPCGSVAAPISSVATPFGPVIFKYPGKPVYCCSDCPTLKAAISAGTAQSYGLLS